MDPPHDPHRTPPHLGDTKSRAARVRISGIRLPLLRLDGPSRLAYGNADYRALLPRRATCRTRHGGMQAPPGGAGLLF